MATNSANGIKIYCSNEIKAELFPLLKEADLPIKITKNFEPDSPGNFAISFKIGSMVVNNLKRILAMFIAKDKVVTLAVTRKDGTTISVDFKNVPANEQTELLEKAHALAITEPTDSRES